MSSLNDKINRATAWLKRENARSDAALLRRPNWWHVGKIMFGALFVLRSVHIMLHAQGLGRYVLAGVLLIGGTISSTKASRF